MGEVSEEIFKADPFSIELLGHVDHFLKDELVTLVVAQSLSSGHDFSNISLTTSVCIEVKESVEVLDLFLIEGGVFRDDGLGENLLPFLFDESLSVDSAHGYFEVNIF